MSPRIPRIHRHTGVTWPFWLVLGLAAICALVDAVAR
jgi:hypothetical protein